MHLYEKNSAIFLYYFQKLTTLKISAIVLNPVAVTQTNITDYSKIHLVDKKTMRKKTKVYHHHPPQRPKPQPQPSPQNGR